MTIGKLSDIEDLIKKGTHIIISLDYYPNGKRFFLRNYEISINDLKSLVKTAVSSKATITIRYADYLDFKDLEELASIGGGNVVLDFSRYSEGEFIASPHL